LNALQSSTLLHKLAPPQPTFPVVERSGVDELERQAARMRLVLVRAPAGFGKTSLLRTLYRRREAAGDRVAWLSLDSGDNDPKRFLAGLIAALGHTAPATPDATADLARPTEADTLEAVLARIATLTRDGARLTLFLDDFEVIRSEIVLGFVRDFLQQLSSANCCLAIACRQDPELQIARLRAQGEVLDIDADQLRLSVPETGALLANILGETLDSDLIARLQQRTEGWVVALQLAALSLRRRVDARSFIEGFGPSLTELAGYLTEEVLARQPPELADLLLKSSILDALHPDLCNEVCGISESGVLLRRIQNDNLFLFALDEAGEWFRYHKLFAQFLQQELRQRHPEQLPILHRRAAEWFLRRDNAAAAIEHALQCGDPGFAIRLADDHAPAATADGRLVTVISWIERLPRELLDRHLRLKIYYAVCLTGTFQHRKVKPLIEALNVPGITRVLDEETRGTLQFVIVLQHVLQDRYAEALEVADATLGWLSSDLALPRHAMMNTRSLCLLKMHRYREVAELEPQVRAMATGVSTYGTVYAECIFGMAELAQGRLRSALAIFSGALTMATEQSSAHSAPAAMASACLAVALYESGELEQSAALLQRYLTTITHMGLPDILLLAHTTNARIAYWHSGYAEACQLLNDLKHLGFERDLPRVIGAAWAEQSRLALLQNDVASAERYLQMAETGAPYAMLWDESGATLRARQLAAQNKPRDAIELLEAERKAANSQGRRRYALKVGVLLALTQKQARQSTEAMKTLAGCVETGAMEPFVRVFADEGSTLGQLLRELRATRDLPEVSIAFVDRLLALTEAPPAANPDSVGGEEQRLSRREFEVLALLADGLSNQVITKKLSLSLPTVKSHVRNVMAKLRAESRSEAVAVARRQGLLQR